MIVKLCMWMLGFIAGFIAGIWVIFNYVLKEED